MKDGWIALLACLGSTGTLVCCALPTLLVAVGFGAAVAGVVSAFPLLVDLGRHKDWLFLVAGGSIAVEAVLVRRQARAAACDPRDESRACTVAYRWNRKLLWITAAVHLTGFAMACLAFPAGRLLGIL